MSVLATYQGPWKGIQVNMPEISIDPAASPSSQNFVFKNGEIRTRNRVNVFAPGTIDLQPIRALASFIDANNVWHTCAITSQGLYQLSGVPGSQNWNLIANFITSGGVGDVYTFARFIAKLYFCIGTNCIFSWDGIANTINIETAIAGGKFIAELNAQVILVSTIESVGGSLQSFPQRIRWSASGAPSQFDPGANVGAGFNDSLDCPDNLTGIITTGRVGFLFRTNGITEITPTGIGISPFEFNHLWASDKGIGNVFPRTVASYGKLGGFVAEDDIYTITSGSLAAVGGAARDAIFTDLNNSTGLVIGSINVHRTPTYISPCYELIIPVSDGCILWQYLFEEQCWQRPKFFRYRPTAEMRYVPTN